MAHWDLGDLRDSGSLARPTKTSQRIPLEPREASFGRRSIRDLSPVAGTVSLGQEPARPVAGFRSRHDYPRVDSFMAQVPGGDPNQQPCLLDMPDRKFGIQGANPGASANMARSLRFRALGFRI